MSYVFCQIDDLESSLYSLQNDYDQSIADNEEYNRTTLEATDSNRLLMLQLKAANYEIEHMSAELHVDRGKMGELESALQARTMELDEISGDLSKCRDNCRAQGVTIENRDESIGKRRRYCRPWWFGKRRRSGLSTRCPFVVGYPRFGASFPKRCGVSHQVKLTRIYSFYDYSRRR